MKPGNCRDFTATLLVACPDRPGLVASVSRCLFDCGANILDAAQHTDPVAKRFFQRIRFSLPDLSNQRTALESAIGQTAARFDMSWRIGYEADVRRVAIFVSRYDHCLYDLLLRHRAGELACEITLIVSNHPDLAKVAEHFGIEYRVFPITKENKSDQEVREWELLERRQIDLVVMARYMQVLTADFIDRYPSRIINIHHSFLPAFSGSKPYRQAHERGVKLIGATAHYATNELDEGPIIAQDVLPVSHRDRVSDLIRKGRDVERMVLARAVRWHLEDRVLVYEQKTVVFD